MVHIIQNLKNMRNSPHITTLHVSAKDMTQFYILFYTIKELSVVVVVIGVVGVGVYHK
jgi:hypothetical protein